MELEFRTCKFEMDNKSYLKFLLENHNELNLTYPFAMSLSFISSPLILGKGLLIISDDPYQIIGVTGFVYGTSANDYEDKHICQVEIVFLKKEYRCTSLFLKVLQALIKEVKHSNPDVEQIQFWSSVNNGELESLFSKFSELPDSTKTLVNNMALYTVLFKELEFFCNRFKFVSRI
ncbi:hypothetical protein [Metabacillus litoralis]|uniref:hypothetical protein n=1 Tax=Metabacillus litoralis TaxID=152268 RepID=UPI001CFE814B|nr:hypothetical protein [Metabacillus litoralis]